MPKRTPAQRAKYRRLYVGNKRMRASVHARMRTLIKESGGVSKFAKRHGCTPKYVYKWYSNGLVPSTDYLIKFATVSGVSPDWVLLGKGKPYLPGHKAPTAVAA